MERKGQAAMEFLMTYGWAILAAIIAIGVLAYFGVFSPGKYATGSTVLNPPFYANAWNVDASSGAVNLEIKNNGGETYNITAVSLTNTPSGVSCTDDSVVGTIAAGATVQANPTCTGLTAGNSFKADVTVTYRKENSAIDLTSTGTISDKVVA